MPTLAPVAIHDDWVYARAVENFLATGNFRVPGLSAATFVFQLAWGALFEVLFGHTLGVLRLSTVVLAGLGAVAFYLGALELGIARRAAAIGTALYLFNPLHLVLVFTFMTDAGFTALTVIASAALLRALRTDSGLWFVLTSVAAGLAFLLRQPAAVIVPVALIGIWFAGWDRRRVLVRAVQVTVPFAVMAGGWTTWLLLVNGVPSAWSFQANPGAGAPELLILAGLFLLTAVLYTGLLLVPITLATHKPVSLRKVAALCVGAVIATVLIRLFIGILLIPSLGDWFTWGGFGSRALAGGYGVLVTAPIRIGLSIAAILGAATLGLVLVRARWTVIRDPLLLTVFVLAIAEALAAGVAAERFHVDRYMLPIFPAVIWLLLAVKRAIPVNLWEAVPLVGFLAVIGIAGTHDHLTFHKQVWELDSYANSLGVDNLHLDGGPAWDGYQEGAIDFTGTISADPTHQWWLDLYAPQIDARYVVATRPLAGYAVVARRPLDTWLGTERLSLYLLKRS